MDDLEMFGGTETGKTNRAENFTDSGDDHKKHQGSGLLRGPVTGTQAGLTAGKSKAGEPGREKPGLLQGKKEAHGDSPEDGSKRLFGRRSS